MSSFKAEISWNATVGATLPNGRQTVEHEHSHAGWWLLPSMIAGAGFWVWAISNLLN